MTLGLSEALDWIFGGGLIAAVTALLAIGPTVRKAKADAERARADAETVRIDNAEHATRILMDNIVEPLKKELNATRREMARLRKAIDGANSCDHRSDCPVLHGLRSLSEGDNGARGGAAVGNNGQRKGGDGEADAGAGPDVRGQAVDTAL